LNKKSHRDSLTDKAAAGPPAWEQEWQREAAERDRDVAEWLEKAVQEARQCVRRWAKPEKPDYAFDWAEQASKQLLEAGSLYEYAREAFEFRCVLAGIKSGKDRSDFRHLMKRGAEAYPALGSHTFNWLCSSADHLAQNTSFSELHRRNEQKVKKSLKSFRSPLKAVSLAFGDYGPAPWPWRPGSYELVSDASKEPGIPRLLFPPKLPERHIHSDGSEKIAVTIRWRDFTNKGIGEEMKKFAKQNRPPGVPERWQLRENMIRTNLKALSAMRIWKRFPKARDLGRRICEAAKYTDYESVIKEAAEYKERSSQGWAKEAKSKAAQVQMHKARERALFFFQILFPGELPSNYPIEKS